MGLQPGLCQTWSETPKTGFLTTRLISDNSCKHFLISICLEGDREYGRNSKILLILLFLICDMKTGQTRFTVRMKRIAKQLKAAMTVHHLYATPRGTSLNVPLFAEIIHFDNLTPICNVSTNFSGTSGNGSNEKHAGFFYFLFL